MTIDEARQKLSDMKSHFAGGFSYNEQQFLEDLHFLYFKKMISNKGCQDCYRDAYIILCNKVKNDTELPKRSDYILKAGIVKHAFSSPDYYILDMPEDAAEKWLHDHPQDIKDFQKYPEDWQDRVNARFATESKISAEADQLSIDEPKVDEPKKRGRKKASI